MIIQKSAILAKLRERGLQVRADWVDRELPDEVDTLRFGGLLATLHLDPQELDDSTVRPPAAPDHRNGA